MTRDAVKDAVARIETIAVKYWTGEFHDPGLPELLVDGEVRIVAIAD